MTQSRIAIFASGSGTNAEAIIKYFQNNNDIEVALVLSNNADAFVLQRAEKFKIPTLTFSREEYKDRSTLLRKLKEFNITHIVLAGFLWMIPDYMLENFPDKIINIHPSLLPRHGGKGMYGIKVHEAVKAAADMETGITIHLVNEHYDEGKILFQARCSVDGNFSVEKIQQCVHELEHKHYPAVIEKWILNAR